MQLLIIPYIFVTSLLSVTNLWKLAIFSITTGFSSLFEAYNFISFPEMSQLAGTQPSTLTS